jgi:hypothetical protein
VTPHVTDERLAAIATAGLDDPADPSQQHVLTCDECGGRLAALQNVLAEVTSVATDEADEVFDASRLARQRDNVLRRLDHAGGPARVIEFPHRARTQRPMRPIAVRWVAAAAAAGLVIGVYAGSHITTTGVTESAESRVTHIAAPPPAQSAPTAAVHETAPPDEEILSEIETALVTPRLPPLQAIDALTPRFREVGLKIR